MGTTVRKKMSQLSPKRRAKIENEADRLHTEYLTLKQLRKARDKTQVQIAQSMGIRQASVAQMENQGDLLISTLRSHIEAMGGSLTLMVQFPDREPVALSGFGDIDES